MDKKIKKYGIEIVLWVLIILLITLCVSLVMEYREVVPRATPTSFRTFLNLKRNHGPLPATSADLIRSWMTFDYINTLFNLPANYLQKTLSEPNVTCFLIYNVGPQTYSTEQV